MTRNDTIFISFLFIAFFIMVGLILYGAIFLVTKGRHDLHLCGDQIDYKFDWTIGDSQLPYSVSYENDTTLFCCYKEKTLSPDGALINRCFLADKK